MKQNAEVLLPLSWLETNYDKLKVRLESISTPFPYDKIDPNEDKEVIPDQLKLQSLFLYIIKYVYRSSNANRHRLPLRHTNYRFLAAFISLLGLEEVSSTKSLLAFCRLHKYDYFYLRRQIISFRQYTKKHSI